MLTCQEPFLFSEREIILFMLTWKAKCVELFCCRVLHAKFSFIFSFKVILYDGCGLKSGVSGSFLFIIVKIEDYREKINNHRFDFSIHTFAVSDWGEISHLQKMALWSYHRDKDVRKIFHFWNRRKLSFWAYIQNIQKLVQLNYYYRDITYDIYMWRQWV